MLFGSDPTPVFVKEDSTAEVDLEKMKELLPLASGYKKQCLERDIKLVEAGIVGERRVAFELRNAHLPLYVIHDLYLKHQGLTTQIDFLVMTPYICLVIECKNLVGDIKIDAEGNFIRTFGYNRHRDSEAIYSPVTQNRRHLELMKSIKLSEEGALMRLSTNLAFEDIYHSVIVLANPASQLKDRAAPEDIKRKVIRADQLVEYIKGLNKEYKHKNGKSGDRALQKWAETWLERGSRYEVDIAKRYGIVPSDEEASLKVAETPTVAKEIRSEPVDEKKLVLPTSSDEETQSPKCPICGAKMILRTARNGKWSGRKFWGCSNYPHCHGIINLK
jgi:hypothetical protein